MKKSTLGILGGASLLAVGAPLLLPLMAYAATASSSSSVKARTMTRPVPTQACVQALAGKDADFLAHIDARIAAQKAATQTHKDALTAAAALTDDTQRQAAVQAADKAFRTAMDAAMASDKTAMDAVAAACGKTMGGPGPMGMMGAKGMGGPGRGHAMMQGKGMMHWGKKASASSSSVSAQ